jgi:hypothetical protein
LLPTGTILAGYRLDGVLGRGGMGVVYEATQLTLDRTVALKVLAPHLSNDTAFRERFRREGQVQAAIDHPHIVTVYEAGETEHGLFLAMRLIRGHTLKDLIIGRELDAGRSLRILRPISSALDTAHHASLIHRDLKPQNVLVAGRDHAYLADFGLTKAVDDTGITRTGQFVGTVDYIAPEQIRGEAASPRTDVYSLAAVMYECLTGVVPYPRPSEIAVLYAHMSDAPPKVSERRPELPAALDEVIARAMAKNPAERFGSAGALLDAAERAFGRQVRAAQTPPGPLARPEETGVRAAEADVATRQGQRPASTVASGTSPGAPAAAGETVEAPFEPTIPGRPQPRPEPSGRSAGGGGRSDWLILGAIVAFVLLVAVAGFIAGHSGSGKSPTSGTSVAAAGPLQLRFPSRSWSRASAPPSIPGMRLTDEIALVPNARVDGETLVAGMDGASGPLLLPARFRRRLPTALTSGQRVRLGSLEAYRYAALAPRGLSGIVTVYTVPTSAGAAAVACVSGKTTPAAFRGQCDNVASSLELRSASAYPLDPSPAYAVALRSALATLADARLSARSTLGSARTAGGEADAAARLAAAYSSAAGRLAATRLSPAAAPAGASLALALRGLGHDYAAAATAANRGNAAAYAAASRAANGDEQALGRALRSLARLGYSAE